PKIERIKSSQTLLLAGEHQISFSYVDHLLFLYHESLPFHPNALTFQAFLKDGKAISETYYSIGGGFVIQENDSQGVLSEIDLPFPVDTAQELMVWCMKTGLKISELVLENELAWRPEEDTRAGVLQIFNAIKECIYKGCHSSGI